MADTAYHDTYYRWEWFHRQQWLAGFRQSEPFARWRAMLEAIGDPEGKRVLDATCGLGRKTLVMDECGLDVMGSDASAYAVERARELALGEAREIDFFVSTWRDLPHRTSERFDAVFVDAFMDCIETYEDLVASFAGIGSALTDGGVFVFGGPEPNEKMADILEFAWDCGERFSIDWRLAAEGRDCTCVCVKDKGDNYIDHNYLYVVRQHEGVMRLETAPLRRWFRWERDSLDKAALSVGFSAIRTELFRGDRFGVEDFTRIIATK